MAATVTLYAGAGERAVPKDGNADTPDGHIVAVAIGGSGASSFALGGSLTLNDFSRTFESRIAAGATVTATAAITADAQDRSVIHSVAGAGSGAGSAAVGASIAKNDIRDRLLVHIDGPNTKVTSTSGNVTLTSDSQAQLSAVTVAGSGAGTFAGGASFAFNAVANDSRAYVAAGAAVNASGEVGLAATEHSTISSWAGGAAGAGSISVAGAVAKNDINNQVRAYITGSSTDVGSGITLGSTVVPAASRVALTAVEQATIDTLSLGAGGAGTFALTGSVSINQIGSVVETYASDGATVTAGGNIDASALEISTILSLSGQAGGAGWGAVGAAASYSVIAAQVRAYADNATLTSNHGSVTFGAGQDPTMKTVAVGGSGAGFLSIQASVVVNTLNSTIEAYIANGSTVTADANVLVLAPCNGADTAAYDPNNLDPDHDHQVNVSAVQALTTTLGLDGINAFAGAASGAYVGASGGVAVDTVRNTTRAYVADSTVNARGNGPEADIPRFNPDTGVVDTDKVRGLAVVATVRENVDVLTTTGAGGVAGITGDVSVTNVADLTESYIAHSNINSRSNFGRQVVVRAHQDSRIDTFGIGAAGGVVGAAAAVDVTSIKNTTRAYISDRDESASDPTTGASVVYGNGIEVSSRTREAVSVFVLGAAGGIVGLAGAVAVGDISSTNNAYVRSSDVNSRGAIAVLAENHASLDTNTGALGGGFIGAGAAVVVGSITNTTRARALGHT